MTLQWSNYTIKTGHKPHQEYAATVILLHVHCTILVVEKMLEIVLPSSWDSRRQVVLYLTMQHNSPSSIPRPALPAEQYLRGLKARHDAQAFYAFWSLRSYSVRSWLQQHLAWGTSCQHLRQWIPSKSRSLPGKTWSRQALCSAVFRVIISQKLSSKHRPLQRSLLSQLQQSLPRPTLVETCRHSAVSKYCLPR